MSLTKNEYREMRKAAERALKEVLRSVKEEPSTVIIIRGETGTSETLVNDITSWLFRRDENGSSNR